MFGTNLRQSGISVLGHVPWGTHFCHFYRTGDDLLSILVPYFKAGLEDNEFCLWVTAEPLSPEAAAQAITEAMPDFPSYVSRGRIEIVPHDEWYLLNGKLDLQRPLNAWVERLNQALERGYEGMRVSGDTVWLKHEWKAFADYEAGINSIIGRLKMIALCTYSLDRCNTNAVFDVLRNHGVALIRDEGKWQIIETSAQTKTREALAEKEEQLRAVLDASTEMMVLLDRDGTILEMNEAHRQIMGVEHDEVLGRNLWGFFRPDVAQRRKALADKVLQSGQPLRAEDEGLDGRWYGASLYPVRDPQGNVSGVAVYSQDITDARQVDDAIRKSEERYRHLMEASSDGISVLDREWRYLLTNEANTRMVRMPKERLLGNRLTEVFPGIEETEFFRAYQRVMESRVGEKVVGAFSFPDGRIGWYEVNVDPVPEGILCIARDITSQKHMLELLRDSEEKYRLVVENVHEGMLVVQDGRIVFTNAKAAELSGRRSEELRGRPIWDFIQTEDMETAAATYKKRIAGEEVPPVYDFSFGDKEGRRKWIEVSAASLEWEGKPALLYFLNDITVRKGAEDNLALENERREVLLGLQGLFDADEQALFDYVVEGSVRSTRSQFSFAALMDESGSMITVHGWSREAKTQCSTQDRPVHYPIADAGLWAECVRQRKPVIVNDYESPSPGKKGYPPGHVAIKRFMSVPVLDAGRVVAVAAVANKQADYDESDASALSVLIYRMWAMVSRGRAEDRLRDNVERYRGLYESVAGGVVVQGKDGHITEANAVAREILGLTIDEITGRTSADPRWHAVREDGSAFAGEDHPSMVSLRTGKGLRNVVMGIHNPVRNEQRWILVNSEPIRDTSSDELEGAVSTFLDITDRRKMIRELLRSEERYRLLVENTHEAVVVIRDGKIIFANSKTEDLTGYSAGDIISRSMLDLIHPDDRELVADRHVRRMRGEKVPSAYEIKLVDRWDRVRWVEVSIAPTRWNGEGPVLIVFLNDITERKKAEEALRTSEERYRLVVENTHEAVVVIRDGRIIFVNSKTADLTGYSANEMISRSMLHFVHPEDQAEVAERYAGKMRGEDVPSFYGMKLVNKWGQVRWVELNATTTRWNGEGTVLIAFLNDITDRKNAEDELKSSEERNRLVVENAHEAIVVVQDDRIVFANPKARGIGGYTAQDLGSRGVLDFVHPDDRQTAGTLYDRRLRGEGAPVGMTFRYIDRWGDTRWGEASAALFDWQGKPAIAAFLNDITERKQAEDALRASEEKYRRIVETANEGIVTTDREGRFTFANSRAALVFGYSVAEMQGMSYTDFVPRKDRGRYCAAWERQKQGASDQYETRLIRKDGSAIWTIVSASPLLEDGGQYGGTLAMITDITRLKEAEESLRKSQRHLKTISDSSLVGIIVSDLKGRIWEANDAFLGITGYTREDLKEGRLNSLKMTPEEYAAANEQAMTELLDKGVSAPFEKEYVRKDGARVPVMVGSALMGAEGGASRIVRVVLDITRVKLAEEAVARERNMLRAIMENTEAQLAYLDRDFNFLEVNSAYVRGSRHSARKLIGRKHFDLFPNRENQAIFERVRDTGKAVRFHDRPFSFADQPARGTTYWDWSLHPVKSASGAVDGLVLSLVETTERVRIQDELMKHHERLESLIELRTRKLTRSYDLLRRQIAERKKVEEQLRGLSNRLVQLQEEERKSLARELHDEIGQSLTMVKLFLDRYHPCLPDETARKDSAEVSAVVKKLMNQVRNLSLDLRPTMLDDLGLVPALQWHFDRFTDQSHVQVNFRQSGLEKKRIPPEVGTAAYRIVQEALTNVARYANVAEAMVSVAAEKGLLRIEVEDHGSGFDVEKAGGGPGAGLSGIRERVIALKGTLTIESAEGAGTYVLAELPLPNGAKRRGRKSPP